MDRALNRTQERTAFLLALVLMAVFGAILTGFSTAANPLSLVRSVSVFGTLGVAMALVVGLVAGLALSLVVWTITGFQIAYVEIPAIIATPAMGIWQPPFAAYWSGRAAYAVLARMKVHVNLSKVVHGVG